MQVMLAGHSVTVGPDSAWVCTSRPVRLPEGEDLHDPLLGQYKQAAMQM